MIRNVSVLLAGKLKLTKYPTLKDLHCSSYQYTVVEPLPRWLSGSGTGLYELEQNLAPDVMDDRSSQDLSINYDNILLYIN